MTKITKRTGIRIYRMKDAPELKGSDFVDDLEYANSELRDVFSFLSALGLPKPRVGAPVARRGWLLGAVPVLQSELSLAPHRHGSDCLYVIVSGSAVMGRQT